MTSSSVPADEDERAGLSSEVLPPDDAHQLEEEKIEGDAGVTVEQALTHRVEGVPGAVASGRS